MAPNPSYIESQEKSLKKQCLWLHLGCNLSLIVGLGVLTLPPFLTNNKVIRVSYLISGFLLGCNTALFSSKLKFIDQRIRILEKATKENFGLQLVTDQILIQEKIKSKLIPQLPSPLPEPEYLDTEYIENEVPVLEIENDQYDSVVLALEEGKTDSYIIQDVLGFKGRNYQKGKTILNEIKEQLND